MCSTICARPKCHCFSVLQPRPFCKAPTSSSYEQFKFGFCSQQHSNMQALSVLGHPPALKGPLFQFTATQAFL